MFMLGATLSSTLKNKARLVSVVVVVVVAVTVSSCAPDLVCAFAVAQV